MTKRKRKEKRKRNKRKRKKKQKRNQEKLLPTAKKRTENLPSGMVHAYVDQKLLKSNKIKSFNG